MHRAPQMIQSLSDKDNSTLSRPVSRTPAGGRVCQDVDKRNRRRRFRKPFRWCGSAQPLLAREILNCFPSVRSTVKARISTIASPNLTAATAALISVQHFPRSCPANIHRDDRQVTCEGFFTIFEILPSHWVKKTVRRVQEQADPVQCHPKTTSRIDVRIRFVTRNNLKRPNHLVFLYLRHRIFHLSTIDSGRKDVSDFSNKFIARLLPNFRFLPAETTVPGLTERARLDNFESKLSLQQDECAKTLVRKTESCLPVQPIGRATKESSLGLNRGCP